MDKIDHDILEAVDRIAGRQSSEGYYDLCCMVQAAVGRVPESFSLEELYPEAQRGSGKNKGALVKSVSRVTVDAWENGDREELCRVFRRRLRYKPSPKELIRALAMFIWQERRASRAQVHYRIVEARYPRRFCLSGESTEPAMCLIMLPRVRSREEAERLAEQFNREQVPIREAQERLLRGELLTAL